MSSETEGYAEEEINPVLNKWILERAHIELVSLELQAVKRSRVLSVAFSMLI